MIPVPIDTQWLINREHYGPEDARQMRNGAWARSWDTDGSPEPSPDRNGWLIAASNGVSIRERVASALARVRRLVAPLPAAQQP
jgi:hypothetical protein